MDHEQVASTEPRLLSAIDEIRELIRDRYPGTIFRVGPGEDGMGTWLVATVDIDDPDEVVDLVIDRLLTLQIEERIPLHVIPIRTPERIAAMLRDHHHRSSTALPVPS